MRVLVTGSTGFVGAAVARHLLAAGHDVRALVRAGSDRRNVDGLNIELVEGSLQNQESLYAATQGCQALFHVAADYRLWVPKPQDMMDANVGGTEALMRAALRAKMQRIVYTSSVATLGFEADGSPASEATMVAEADMIGTYKRSKFLAERVVERMVRDYKLPAVIVNPSTPIGPRDIRPTPTGRIIVDAARGKIPAFVDTGLNIVHVDDVARGHMLAFERGVIGHKYVLGGDDLPLAHILAMIANAAGRPAPTRQLSRKALYPIAAIMEAIAHITGKEPLMTRDGLRMSEHRMYFSSAKAERELGYTHRPAIEAITDALAWFQQNGYC